MLRATLRIAAATAVLAACTAVPTEEAAQSANDAAMVANPNLGADFSGRGVALAPSAPPARPEMVKVAQGNQALPVQQGDKIIRSGAVNIRVDSVEVAMEAVKGMAASLGGMVASANIMNGEHEVRSATLELRIPAARFDDAMTGVRPLGRVEHSSTSAMDVGEEYVDIAARIANAKRLEQRLVSLLATRTGKLEDVLAVERELARVREEIERYEGRIRYFDSRIAMSSVSVTMHEPAPIIASQPGTNPIRLAFVKMWRNFVHFVAAGIESLGVVIPVALIAFALLVGYRRWRKNRLFTEPRAS